MSLGTCTGVQHSRGGREASTLRMCRFRMVARRAHCAEGACRGNLKAIFHVRPLSCAVPVLEIWLRAAEFRHNCCARGKGLLVVCGWAPSASSCLAGRTNPTGAPRGRSRIAAHTLPIAAASPDGRHLPSTHARRLAPQLHQQLDGRNCRRRIDRLRLHHGRSSLSPLVPRRTALWYQVIQ